MCEVWKAVGDYNAVGDKVHGGADIEGGSEGLECQADLVGYDRVDNGIEDLVRPGLITVIYQEVQSRLIGVGLHSFGVSPAGFLGSAHHEVRSGSFDVGIVSVGFRHVADLVVIDVAAFVGR